MSVPPGVQTQNRSLSVLHCPGIDVESWQVDPDGHHHQNTSILSLKHYAQLIYWLVLGFFVSKHEPYSRETISGWMDKYIEGWMDI